MVFNLAVYVRDLNSFFYKQRNHEIQISRTLLIKKKKNGQYFTAKFYWKFWAKSAIMTSLNVIHGMFVLSWYERKEETQSSAMVLPGGKRRPIAMPWYYRVSRQKNKETNKQTNKSKQTKQRNKNKNKKTQSLHGTYIFRTRKIFNK